MEYGVDVLLTGHDEMLEHSAVDGEQQLADGERAPHRLHVFDVGVGGDGLRGPDPLAENPQRVFLAHADAPERWSDDGILLDGGRHYGHLDVRIEHDDGIWRAKLEPVYVFPVMNAAGELQRFEARRYDDSVVLERPNDD